jgi:hypothetical protein
MPPEHAVLVVPVRGSTVSKSRPGRNSVNDSRGPFYPLFRTQFGVSVVMVAALFAVLGVLVVLFVGFSPVSISQSVREPLLEVGISLALFGPTTLVITLLASRQLEGELMANVSSTLQKIEQQSKDIREDLQPLSGNWRELGLTNVYLTRADALKEFGEHIVNELSHARAEEIMHATETPTSTPSANMLGNMSPDGTATSSHAGSQAPPTIRLWIAASSMKGLLESASKEFDGMGIFSWAASLAGEGKIDLRILMTHPEFAEVRAHQESRNANSITEEIKEALRHLKKWDVPLSCIRMAEATPTVFAIATRERMLLNPYPYGQEAYRSFTLTVRRAREDQSNHPDIHRDIFEQYQSRHFELPWASALPLVNYDNVPDTRKQNTIPSSPPGVPLTQLPNAGQARPADMWGQPVGGRTRDIPETTQAVNV